MSNLLTISGVRGFIDESGTAQLNLEDVARGLGFTQTQTKGDKQYTSVRWVTVYEYLEGFGFPQLAGEENKESFIPENIFYRLAMKAKNETAEKFQAIVADEILPAIRKTGTYSVAPQLSQLEIMVQSAQALLEHDKEINQLTANQTKQAEELQGMRDVIKLSTISWRKDSTDLLVKIARTTGDALTISDLWKDVYKLLDSRMGVNIKQRITT